MLSLLFHAELTVSDFVGISHHQIQWDMESFPAMITTVNSLQNSKILKNFIFYVFFLKFLNKMCEYFLNTVS